MTRKNRPPPWCSLIGILLAFSAMESSSLQLNVPLMQQQYAYWCWAASDAMVSAYFSGSPVNRRTDVGIVSEFLGTNCALQSDGFPPVRCRIAGSTILMKGVNQYFPRFNSMSKSATPTSPPVTPFPYTFARVVTQLDLSKPLEWSYSDPGSNVGHTVVIIGYGNGTLIVNDPATGGQRAVTQAFYEDALNQYSTTYNYTNKAP
jgi:hypothetical protein